MKMKNLLSAIAFAAVLPAVAADGDLLKFGCAYYPEAWPESRWAEDLRDMKAAGLSIIRIGEFNWSGFEPTEGDFDFAPYRRFLALCDEVGMDVMMCTPTAALPPWMTTDYPETERVDEKGHRPPIGTRQTRCPSRPKFRFFATRIAKEMAEAFREFKCIRVWQLDNEIHLTAGFDPCCCPDCEEGFRTWLKMRYGSLDELNKAWNHAFWSARFTDWEQIRLPISKGREPWRVEFAKFQSDVYVGFLHEQASRIRAAFPDALITSNGSEMSGHLRLDEAYRDLGYAATDTYVTDAFENRAKWMWGLSRGITGAQQPFMVAEMGPFSWDADGKNADRKVETWVRDAAKHGAEYLLFFRWRQSVSGEQYHPAILPWSGKKGTGYEFVKKIAASGIRTEMPKSGVAILHSNESDQDTLVRGRNIQFGQYEDASILLNATLEKRGILPDYLMSGRDVDFSPYRFVFVPVNTIVPSEVAAKLKDYVKAGGKVLAICRLNLLDPKGGSYFTEPYPVGMTDLFGLEIHEQRARPDWKYAYDLVEPKRCWTLLSLKEGAFAGKPALTSVEYGRGRAFYYAKLPQTEEEMEMLLDRTLGITEAKRAEFLKIAEQAMVTPVLDTAPAAKYLVKNQRYCMNSGFDMTPKGRIWTSWVGGEDGARAFLIQHHSDDGGQTWSETDFVVDPHVREKKPDFICSITSNFWTDPDGRLHFFFDQSMGCAYGDPRGTTHMDGRAGVWESVCANPDDAKPVWSAPRRIGDGHALNKPIVAKDGTWYLPVCLNNGGGLWGKVFTDLDARRGVNIYASTDQGRTWEYRGNCRVPMTDWHEPQLVELEDGRLWLLSRVWHCHNDRGIVQSFSKDGGRTWDETSYPGINNPIARFVCRKLRSGNILLVCHGRPEAWVGERTDLTAWLSRDDGKTWEGGLLLDGRPRVSYPDAFQAPDGSIWIQWDWRRTKGEIRFARLTETDILAGKVVTPGSRIDGRVADCTGDAVAAETAKWQRKIDETSAAGGGTVKMPAGRHVVGTVYLKSGVTLELEKGCVLEGVPDISYYPNIHLKYAEIREPWQGLVAAEDQHDIALVGEGEVFGCGASFPRDTRLGRPRGILFSRCRNVRIENVKLRDLASWTCYLKECDGVVVRKVTVNSHANGNNDGIDIESKNVLVEDCFFDSDDDGIVLKSDNPDFLVENVEIRNCKAFSCCSTIKLGTASHGGFKNINIHDIVCGAASREYINPKTGNGMLSEYRVETWPGATLERCPISGIAIEGVDGGLLENITVRNVEIREATCPIFIRGGLRYGRKWGNAVDLGIPMGTAKTVRNITIENVRAKAKSFTASSITGVPDLRLKGITLRNVEIEVPGAGEAGKAEIGKPVPEKVDAYPESNMFDARMLPAYGFYLRHADDVLFDNVKVKVLGTEFRQELVAEDVTWRTARK